MSRKRIEAGKAYVGLGVRSKLKQGLGRAKARLRSFGSFARKNGRRMAVAGLAITAALFGSSKAFAKAGDELDKMSARTSISVESLSRLKFAAERNGAALGDVEKASRGMARTLFDAEQGLSMATDTLDELGLSVDDLKGKSVEDQFALYADKISKIEDPSKRTALAMRIFGKSGTALLPMLAGGSKGMKALGAESDRLGHTLSKEQTDAAAKLTDAYGDLGLGLKGIVVQIGAAVAGPFTAIANQTATIVSHVIGWIKENQGLVQGIAAFGVALTIAGVALLGVGGAIAALMVVAPVLAGVLGLLLNPFILIPAAIAAAVVAFLYFTDTGRGVVKWFMESFMSLLGIVTSTLGGISDALQAGDLALAAKIGFTGVKLAIAAIMEEVESIFGVSFEGMFQVVARLGKAIAGVLARLNVARQKGANFLANQIGKLALSGEAQKALREDNARALGRAKGVVDDVTNFDADKFGSDLRSSFNVSDLTAELAALKEEAAQLKKDGQAVPDLEGLTPAPAIEAATSKLKESFANFASLRGGSAARGGPGARGTEEKILKTLEDGNDKQDKIVDAIYETAPRFG